MPPDSGSKDASNRSDADRDGRRRRDWTHHRASLGEPSAGCQPGSQSAGMSGVCGVIVPVKPGGNFGFATTEPDGTYKVSGLAAGQYQVNFADPNCFFSPNDDLAPQWFNDQQTQATANDVTVTAGATTGGINATPVTDRSDSGSATHQAQAPVRRECVMANSRRAASDAP